MYFSLNLDDDCPTASKVFKASDSSEAVEAFQLTPQQQHLIREDHQNQKLWDEVLVHLVEGPVSTFFFFISLHTFIS